MKVAILGFGREGKSVLNFLRRSPKFQLAETWVLDANSKTKIPPGVHSHLGKKYLSGLSKFDWVFRSPGIPYNLPPLKLARRAGTKFTSATKIFFEEAEVRGVKVIGVSGSKGKTTTAHLLYQMLRAVKKPASLAGNVGNSPLELLPRLDKKSLVILELSSFQLQDLKQSPPVAILLDLFPEHQDAHKDVAEYYAAKSNLNRFQKKGDAVFYLDHNPLTRRLAKLGRGKKVAVAINKFRLFSPADMRLKGPHAFLNAAAAATAARHLGVAPDIIRRVVRGFRGVPHRLELVRTLRVPRASIRIYNDSASTNPQTSAAAIRAFPKDKKIILMGGYDKGLDYAPLARALKNSGTELALLYGQNRDKILRAIRPAGVSVRRTKNMAGALRIAWQAAQKLGSSVILLSPGAASFDQFRNYAERGDIFRALAHKLR